jgi:hypothetical protein
MGVRSTVLVVFDLPKLEPQTYQPKMTDRLIHIPYPCNSDIRSHMLFRDPCFNKNRETLASFLPNIMWTKQKLLCSKFVTVSSTLGWKQYICETVYMWNSIYVKQYICETVYMWNSTYVKQYICETLYMWNSIYVKQYMCETVYMWYSIYVKQYICEAVYMWNSMYMWNNIYVKQYICETWMLLADVNWHVVRMLHLIGSMDDYGLYFEKRIIVEARGWFC